MNQLMKKLIFVVFIFLFSFSSWAISLEQAKQKGLVGEMANGYLGVVIKSPEVSHLVDTINTKRKSLYINIARENKLSMQQITTLPRKKAIAKPQPRHLINDVTDEWIKK